jgi:hypothetical protein
MTINQPPGRLDPPSERPVPSHLLDPFEESSVEVSEYYARQRDLAAAEFAALLHSKDQPKKEISDAQLAANRANAQLSTGPTSAEGKAVSARNHFRHGLTQTEGDLILLESESKLEYSQSLAEFQAEWQPTTATERDLVERLASHQWLRRRALKLQKLYLAENGQILDYDQFALYRRYETSHERSYNKALADLIRVRALRLREQNGFESQQRKNAEQVFRIRTLENREKLQGLALRYAEIGIQRAEDKLQRLSPTLKPPL